MNNTQQTTTKKPLFRRISKILFILHGLALVFFTFFMFAMIILDDYFGLLSEYILRMIFISLIVGLFLIIDNSKLIFFIMYILSTIIIFFSGFLLITPFLMDMPAYLNEDYQYTSGQITDVKFKSTKHGEDIVKYFYIDGERYKIGMQTITESYFEENFGLNSYVQINYLEHSKQIISIE